MPVGGQVIRKKIFFWNKIFFYILKIYEERSRIRIWIRTEMSRIPNTDYYTVPWTVFAFTKGFRIILRCCELWKRVDSKNLMINWLLFVVCQIARRWLGWRKPNQLYWKAFLIGYPNYLIWWMAGSEWKRLAYWRSWDWSVDCYFCHIAKSCMINWLEHWVFSGGNQRLREVGDLSVLLHCKWHDQSDMLDAVSWLGCYKLHN